MIFPQPLKKTKLVGYIQTGSGPHLACGDTLVGPPWYDLFQWATYHMKGMPSCCVTQVTCSRLNSEALIQ